MTDSSGTDDGDKENDSKAEEDKSREEEEQQQQQSEQHSGDEFSLSDGENSVVWRFRSWILSYFFSHCYNIILLLHSAASVDHTSVFHTIMMIIIYDFPQLYSPLKSSITPAKGTLLILSIVKTCCPNRNDIISSLRLTFILWPLLKESNETLSVNRSIIRINKEHSHMKE